MGRIPEATKEVLKNKNFVLFLLYRFCLTFSTIMISLIVSWQVYSLTKDVFLLGVIGLVEVIPQVSVSLFAGHYVDIWDRRKIIRNTLLILFLSSLILIAYNMPMWNCYSLFGVFPIFITIFLTGLVRGIVMPANSAILGELTETRLLANAAAISSANWQIAAVAGPALGGLIYGFFGALTAYICSGVILALGFAFISLVKYESKVKKESKNEDIYDSIKTGLKYVLSNQIILGAFSLDLFAVLFGGAAAMLPVFASEVLFVGAQGLGLLRAAPAVGAIVVSVFLSIYPPLKNSGHKLLISVFGFGLCMIGFALSNNFYLSFLLLLLSGALDNVSVVVRGSILQMFTPNEMRGRVASVNSIFIGSSNELGSFESGLAAKIMGLIPSVVFGGVMTLIVVGVASVKAPILRKLSLQDAIRD